MLSGGGSFARMAANRRPYLTSLLTQPKKRRCTMRSTLAANWWLLALRGGAAIIFGILAFFWPGLAWLAVLISFAAFALVDGIFSIMAAVRGQAKGGWWWALVLEGILGITAAILTLVYPNLTQLALLYVIAAWAVATGILEIVAAIRL